MLFRSAPKEGTREGREFSDKERIDKFIKKLESEKEDNVIALFTHGNVIKYLLSKYLGSNPKGSGPHLYIAEASISLVDINKNKTSIHFINNLEHLKKELSFFDETSTNQIVD